MKLRNCINCKYLKECDGRLYCECTCEESLAKIIINEFEEGCIFYEEGTNRKMSDKTEKQKIKLLSSIDESIKRLIEQNDEAVKVAHNLTEDALTETLTGVDFKTCEHYEFTAPKVKDVQPKLSKSERAYIERIVEPFSPHLAGVTKVASEPCIGRAFLHLSIKDDNAGYDCCDTFSFVDDELFTGLEYDKVYTGEELGL